MTTLFLSGLLATFAQAEAPVEIPLPSQPYRIRVMLDFENHPRFSPTLQAGVRQEFLNFVTRFAGESWNVTFAEPDRAMRNEIDIPLPEQTLKSALSDGDKLIWVQLENGNPDGTHGPVEIAVREYDNQFSLWGPVLREPSPSSQQLSYQLFSLVHRQFRPTIRVVAQPKPGNIQVAVKGLALQPRDTGFSFVGSGMPFRMFRDALDKNKKLVRNEMAWTYLLYQSSTQSGQTAHFSVVSAYRNPIPTRVTRRYETLGIAVSVPKDASTTVQFLSKRNQLPIEGYELAMKTLTEPALVRVGNTDRRGRVTIKPMQIGSNPVKTDRPQVFQGLLRIGKIVLASFPIVPGSHESLQVSVTVDPFLTEVNGKILGLQTEMVDTVAQRSLLTKHVSILESKLEALSEDKKKEKAERDKEAAAIQNQAKALAERINKLPGKQAFQERLTKIINDTEKRQKAANMPTMGKSIRSLYKQTEVLLATYFAKDRVTIEFEKEGEGHGQPPAQP